MPEDTGVANGIELILQSISRRPGAVAFDNSERALENKEDGL